MTAVQEEDHVAEELEAILNNPTHHAIIQINSHDQREFVIDNEIYRQLEVLGNTKNSHTYLVEGPSGKAVLKSLNLRIPKNLNPSEKLKQIQLFEREASILGKLDHPQIPKLQKYFQAEIMGDTTFYILEEHITGDTLEQLISQHHKNGDKIPPKQAAQILLSVLEPLEYCHSLPQPVLHRDIKPSNILVDKNDTAKLVDFGSAIDHKISSLGGSTIAGTFGNTAPEQWFGQASPQSDIYGIGTTLLEMLTGIQPAEMHDQNAANFDERFKINYKPHLQDIDPNLINIIDNCLKLNPQHRYTSLSILKTDLENYLAGKSKVELQQKEKRLDKQSRPHGLLMAAGIIAAMTSASLGFVYYYTPSTKQETAQVQKQDDLESVTAEYKFEHYGTNYIFTSTLYYKRDDKTKPINSEIHYNCNLNNQPDCETKIAPQELSKILEENLQSNMIFEYRQNLNEEIYKIDSQETKDSILLNMKNNFKNDSNIEMVKLDISFEKDINPPIKQYRKATRNKL